MAVRASGKDTTAAAAGGNTPAVTAPEEILIVATVVESAVATAAEGLSRHSYRGLHYPGLCCYYGLHAPLSALPDYSKS